jgi:SNF2 family DNA or RNA helicase
MFNRAEWIEYTVIKNKSAGMGSRFVFNNTGLVSLTELLVVQAAASGRYFDAEEYAPIFPLTLELNEGSFTQQRPSISFPLVTVVQHEKQLLVECECTGNGDKLCEHGALVLTAIISHEALGCFFNTRLRHEKIKPYARDYGLENEPDPDQFFTITYEQKRLLIKPGLPSLVPVTANSLQAMNALANTDTDLLSQTPMAAADSTMCVVLKQHKYHKYLVIELYQGVVGKNGKMKNPLTLVPPLDLTWQSDDPDHVKFFTAIHKFQGHADGKKKESDIKALRAIFKNPLGFDFYYHLSEVSDNITTTSIAPVKPAIFSGDVTLTVDQHDQFYEVGGQLTLHGTVYALKDISLKFTYCFLVGETLYLIDKLQVLGAMDLLRYRPDNLLIHHSRFAALRNQLLTKMEDKITIQYKYIEAATPAQLEEQGFNKEAEQLIYLSDLGNYIMIIPVMRYAEVEIPIRSKKQVYASGETGKEFSVARNSQAEIAFMALLLRQHPYFEEQLENDLYYFYLHRKHFLSEEWFLNAFEDWQNKDIQVFGFNELAGNKLNPHKVKVDIKVLSGINWFNAIISARFGKKKAALKHIHKAIRDKSKYVSLDDGTLGILPEAWIEKFTQYFNTGEIIDVDSLQIAKINFTAVEQLYEQQMLDQQVIRELDLFREKIQDFTNITDIEVPSALQATLRPYQKTGLNWLNFLDDFNFGGCLADDMGLGKSIQVIAFILSQRKKVAQNTNLIVVPATLIFNWQAEVAKFAPSIKVHTIYGADRIKNIQDLDQYEIVLTSYGTLLSDINILKEYHFNYIFLDESHNIKNPETQRYKAVCLLQSRNKIAVTGTPVENNTYDLFSQLSFACPGLLGSKQYFKEVYSIPIDRFKSSKRAADLQRKIEPFVLRRTKQQVASDLPDKTEMVLYCEMGEQQRKIYDAHEKEFREYISATTGEELKRNQLNVLKGLTRLRQICDAPALLGKDKYSRENAVKIDLLMEQILEKSPNHKILVFSQFVSMLDLIRLELTDRSIGFAYLTGSVTKREAVVQSFQNDPACRVFLISLKVGGTGLNLTAADYVYLIDPWWNPAVENQAIDRVHRIGQDKHVIAIRMICKDTLEEKMMKIQASKKELSQDLVKSNSSLLSALDKGDLLNLLTD